jgi:hypothetical protein
MHPIRTLAHPDDPTRGRLRRRKMDVGQLRDCVTKRIVKIARRKITSVNVTQQPTRRDRRQSTSHRLDPITKHQNDVRPEPLQRFRNPQDARRQAQRLIRRTIIPALHRHASIDGEPVALDITHRVSKPSQKMHPRRDRLKLK